MHTCYMYTKVCYKLCLTSYFWPPTLLYKFLNHEHRCARLPTNNLILQNFKNACFFVCFLQILLPCVMDSFNQWIITLFFEDYCPIFNLYANTLSIFNQHPPKSKNLLLIFTLWKFYFTQIVLFWISNLPQVMGITCIGTALHLHKKGVCNKYYCHYPKSSLFWMFIPNRENLLPQSGEWNDKNNEQQ
jgi:hypothetical protein